MKKIDLYNQLHRIRSLDVSIWDNWIDWRLKQAGVRRDDVNTQLWGDVVDGIPEVYDWEIEKENLCFTWIDNKGEKQTELVPLSCFVDDLNEQPNLEMLWHSDYYDGPLSGMALYNDEMVWFAYEDYGDWCEDKVRSYTLYRLNEDVADELVRRHELFRKLVGCHCDHRPSEHSGEVNTDKGTLKAFYIMQEQWSAFDHLECDKLGVFAYHQFKYYARPR